MPLPKALGIAAVAFKNGFFIFKTTSVKPDPTAGRETPKCSCRMTKTTRHLILNASEESRVLMGRILNEMDNFF